MSRRQLSTERALQPNDLARPLRKLGGLAVSQGWTVSLRNNGHLRWRSPSGSTVFHERYAVRQPGCGAQDHP